MLLNKAWRVKGEKMQPPSRNDYYTLGTINPLLVD
jgi:hypothetical protein